MFTPHVPKYTVLKVDVWQNVCHGDRKTLANYVAVNERLKMVDVRAAAEEYFRSLNPIARRISDDIKATKENYESAWDYLSLEEQKQVINESVIHPDAVLRYALKEKVGVDKQVEVYPTVQVSYGCKIFQDETGVEWQDEHSAPFSWKTSSQLVLNKTSPKPTPIKDNIQEFIKKRPPIPPPKPPKLLIEQCMEEKSEKSISLDSSPSSEPMDDSFFTSDEHPPSRNSQVQYFTISLIIRLTNILCFRSYYPKLVVTY